MRGLLARTGALIGMAALVPACTAGPGVGRDAGPVSRATANATSGPAGTSPAPTLAAPSPAAHAPVRAADSPLGRILVDEAGRTLYYFEKEEDGVPGCYRECAATWSPYLTQGAPEPGEGATPHLVGTTDRTDGTTQVTYAGRPLYRYAGDAKRGEVTGDGVEGFGAGWHAVTPKGKRP